MLRFNLFLCLWINTVAASSLIGDPSGFVSVSWEKGQWKVIPDLVDWDEDHTVIARANFTNAQNSTGWMILEVQTREEVPDQLQAQAAGIAEGYLTRTSITESYHEFYTNDVCSTDPDMCHWIKATFEQNEAHVGGKIAQFSQTEPYWHQVNLYYLQMSGMGQGWQLKSDEDPLEGDADIDNPTIIMHLNFIADFWDLVEQYKLLDRHSEETADLQGLHAWWSSSIWRTRMTSSLVIIHGMNTEPCPTES